MAQALRREDSVECSIAELRELEQQRRTEDQARRLADERRRADAEALRERSRLAAEAEQRQIAVATAEQGRLEAERAKIQAEADRARYATEARLAEQRLALEIERARSAPIEASPLRPHRHYLTAVLVGLLFLVQLVGFLEQQRATRRDQAIRGEIDRVAAGIDTVDTRLAGEIRATGARLEQLVEARPVATPNPTKPPASSSTHTRPPNTRPPPSTRPAGHGAGQGVVELDCDVSSPLCK